MSSPARVGFKFLGRNATPEQPCLLGTSFCNPDDFDNWLKHTQQCIFATLNRAKTYEQLKSLRGMVRRLSTLEATGRHGIIECFKLTEPTRALVDMAVDLANVANTLGPPVTTDEVRPDLSRPLVQLPIEPNLQEELGWDWSIDKFLTDIGAAANVTLDTLIAGAKNEWVQKNLPLIVIGAVIFFGLGEKRRRGAR